MRVARIAPFAHLALHIVSIKPNSFAYLVRLKLQIWKGLNKKFCQMKKNTNSPMEELLKSLRNVSDEKDDGKEVRQ